MSGHYQIFVPVDIRWQPSKDAADAAVSLLKSIGIEPDQITFEFSDELQFQDPGGNWSGVECPACDAEIDDWFYKTMTDRHGTAFKDLDVTTPCCAHPTTLDALHFVWPASFCRFRLRIINSRIAVTEAQMGRLEESLGSKLKLIWQRI